MPQTVITGSASGIGAATRKRLEGLGHEVLGVDLRDAEIIADLSTVEGRAEALDSILVRSDGHVDGLVLCAGLGPVQAPSDVIVAVNYFGAVVLLDGLREALAAASPSEVIVVVSNSATVVQGAPEPFLDAMLDGNVDEAARLAADIDTSMAYAASKFAVGRALRRRAPEFAEAGIRVNGVAPGPIQTPLLQAGLDDPDTGPLIRDFPVPVGGFGQPDDVAVAIEFLMSPQAWFCCGSILFIDGGTDALLRPDSF